MNKIHWYILTGCMVLSSACLYALYSFSGLNKEMVRLNFKRKFADGYLINLAELDLGYNTYYFSGFSKNHVYFGNSTAPFHFVETSAMLDDTVRRVVSVSVDSVMNDKRFRLTVDSPNFYISHGVMPLVLEGKLGRNYGTPAMTDEGYYFVEAKLIGRSRFAFRCYDTQNKQYELALKTRDTLEFRDSLLTAQGEGLFSVDGQLTFDRKQKILVYSYFYKNEIIVADTNLNLKHRFHSIDTFSHVHIGVSQINEQETVMNRPPLVVNRKSFAYDGLLYVESNILGKEEDTEFFLMDTVIDVYSIIDGTYQFSFYIPRGTEGKVSEFAVNGKFLYARYEQKVVVYSIDDLIRKNL